MSMNSHFQCCFIFLMNVNNFGALEGSKPSMLLILAYVRRHLVKIYESWFSAFLRGFGPIDVDDFRVCDCALFYFGV